MKERDALDKWGKAAAGGYQVVPHQLLVLQNRLGLTSNQIIILLNLSMHWWKKEDLPFIGPHNIAKRMGLSRRTIDRELKLLCERGLIKKQRRDAVRSRGGVLAFGSDHEIRKTFSEFEITDFAPHPIETSRLEFDSAELRLLRLALIRALARVRPLIFLKQSRSLLLIDINRASTTDLASLQQLVGHLKGIIPGTSVEWAEALRIKLDYRLRRLWLVIEPTIYLAELNSEKERYIAAAFVKERLAVRYNRLSNAILDAWIVFLFGDNQEVRLSTFNINGLDASFLLTRVTAFSRRHESSR